MIPALIVPVLRPDLVRRMLATVDVPAAITIVIDNGGQCGPIDGAHVITMPANLGVGASWNLGMKLTPRAPWWAFVNDDVILSPGDLSSLAGAASEPGPRVVVANGFHCFALNAEALLRVGYFDENYHPAYVEDVDYERRCRLAEVPIVRLQSVIHHSSSTLDVPEYRAQNGQSYHANVDYHHRKWGGGVRSGERFATPFDSGQGIDCWTLDPRRLADQGWRTTMQYVEDDETR